ncbi:WD repeat-containing protein 89 [Austrofundulus limnaeus]|uniref:WD repeat-containing protein 89 n=1 Tax=Austrofundulus limnaeus TaxID=52670 RepID=A0A2I4CSF8_AUSLI|nr:PREDICTED: WD repeat-containing protein 89 [Austrofundulus limnaeus]
MDGLEEKLKGLSLTRRSQQDGSMYLLHGALQPGGLLAVSCSDHTVRLQDRTTLDLLGQYQGHTGPLCGLTFARTSSDLLYSGSADGTVRAWDVRRPGTEAVQVFSGDPCHRFCSVDLNCSDSLLCAGTEQVDREDSFLVFWDCRKAGGRLLGVFSESHSDDITQVCFHPRDRDRLASGSMDGLVNVFDLSQGPEDQALLLTCNSDSSAAVVVWSGPDHSQLLCLSHAEGLHLWDVAQLESDRPLTLFSCRDARSLTPLPGGRGLDYLVGGQWLEEEQTLLVVGGQSEGDLHLMGCDSGGLRLLSSLQGGHTSTVRCFLWDAEGHALITGGEEAQLLLWKPADNKQLGGRSQLEGRSQLMKSHSALKVRSRTHRKTGYHRDKKD